MRRFHYFFKKLTYALIAAIVISNYVGPINNNFLSTGLTSQITYAKKTKKRTKKVKKASVLTNWRWKNPKATIYIDLNSNRNLMSATNAAIAAWNSTGVFTFIKTKNKNTADITIGQVYRPHIDYAGYTTLHYYVKSGVLFSATTKLNTYYLDNYSTYNYSHDRVINTVEHELGHALGLRHSSGVSVMYPSGSVFPIQPGDIENVQKLYQN